MTPICRSQSPHHAGSARILWLVVMFLVASSCDSARNAGTASAHREPFNVLIVVLDACRADKFSCYGFEHPTTPNIDALANDPDAVIFRRHYVQGTWTKPSTASLFSSLLVRQHGVVLGEVPVGAAAASQSEGGRFRTQALAGEVTTLAERFRDGGFATFAVLRNDHLVPAYGFQQGFTTYDSLSYETPGGDWQLTERFVERIRTTPGRQFGYLHLSGCHYPFDVSARDTQYLEQYGFPYDEAARRTAGVDFTTSSIKSAIKTAALQLSPEDVRFLNLIYEAHLRRTDRIFIASLLEGLRQAGRYDDTLLVLTADHGEELYDHAGYGHGQALWEELIHVPMIIKFPKGQKPARLGREVGTLTSAVDLMPSLLKLAGQRVPEHAAGIDIFRGATRDYVISEKGEAGEWALIRDGYKLIETQREPLLFNLGSDPRERSNLAASDPSRVAALRAFARQVLDAAAAQSVKAPVIDQHLPAGVVENLRKLGYLK